MSNYKIRSEFEQRNQVKPSSFWFLRLHPLEFTQSAVESQAHHYTRNSQHRKKCCCAGALPSAEHSYQYAVRLSGHQRLKQLIYQQAAQEKSHRDGEEL